ncbi:MAG: dTDP-4-dehydrorhamnose reductase [Deltaproteobacteria bacterium]|nr:dTDP-4-dehydrorhamnose reductase [Deltaproteobacteria bacterium]
MSGLRPTAPPSAKTGLILVAGAGGLMGRALVEVLSSEGLTVLGLDHAALDVTDGPACRRVVEEHQPRWVVNCAAYTQVDRAEDEEERADRLNAQGAANLARAAGLVGAKVIYPSTDFVFDGHKDQPYTEGDPPAPLSAYGRSKWAGEIATRQENPNHLILRTSWLFGPHGPNFVNTILRLGRVEEELRIVDDQIGSPTYSLDLAGALPRILELELTGVFHLANQGQTSWFGLARRALKAAGLEVRLIPTTSDRLSRKADRPAFSVLDCRRLGRLGVSLRPWEEAVDDYLAAWGEQ